jgi:transcriptional regulator with XRE-family HTH domain
VKAKTSLRVGTEYSQSWQSQLQINTESLRIVYKAVNSRGMSKRFVDVSGVRLREIRESLFLNQSQFADKIGMSREWLGDAERVGRRTVYPRVLGEVADALGLKPEELLAPPEVAAETPVDDESKAMRLAFDAMSEEERQRWIAAARHPDAAHYSPPTTRAAASSRKQSPPPKPKRS